ncbi:SDR family oxidoreductase [Algibacillus agarilyticus]|uniref:SDR family oxidoreductase n=1 Tax=Algibacillus agarilyticus TaxID=2234133 RepID=UPI000DCF94A9|nr:SDR family oxidoreductase [Algibacillus agarilyticus]
MKTILITGANRGIGFSLTNHYASEGCKVFATCRNLHHAEDLLTLAKENENIIVHDLDVSEATSIKNLALELSGETIDILINNAGVYGPKGIENHMITADEWLDVLRINTIAPFMVTQAFEANLARSHVKKIAFLSSKMGSMADNGSGGSYIYRSSKAALNSVVKSLSIDLVTKEIKVVALHPGWVLTEMGGPNALINTDESTLGLTKVIDNLTDEQSGQFISFDGTVIPW